MILSFQLSMASGDGTQVLTSQPGISYSWGHHSSPLCLLVCMYLGEDWEWRVLLIYIPVDTAKCFTLPPETHPDHHLVLINHIFRRVILIILGKYSILVSFVFFPQLLMSLPLFCVFVVEIDAENYLF